MADIAQIFEATNTGLTYIRTIAETPGIRSIPYVSNVADAIAALQLAYKLGVDISKEVAAFKETFSGGEPSPEQVAALDAEISVLRARLHAPMPPREEGEED